MKYIYSTAIFIVFLYATSLIIDFNYKQVVENVDMNGNDISKIVVDIDDANVSLSTTVDKDIKIEHLYSDESNPTSNLYTYQTDDTLYVNEYPYNNHNLITKKETVNIYIPEEYAFDKLDVTTTSGQVNVDSLDIGQLSVKSNTGNVDIANVTADNIIIGGTQFGVDITNVVTDKIIANVDKMYLNLNNSITNSLKLKSESNSTINISKLIADNITVDAKKSDLNLKLSDSLNYTFKTKALIGNGKLTATDEGYEFMKNKSASVVEYNITEINTIDVEFEKVEVDKDE